MCVTNAILPHVSRNIVLAFLCLTLCIKRQNTSLSLDWCLWSYLYTDDHQSAFMFGRFVVAMMSGVLCCFILIADIVINVCVVFFCNLLSDTVLPTHSIMSPSEQLLVSFVLSSWHCLVANTIHNGGGKIMCRVESLVWFCDSGLFLFDSLFSLRDVLGIQEKYC